MITVRPYTSDDYGDIRSILEPETMWDEGWEDKDNLEAMIASDPQSILVATRAGVIIGCLFLIAHGKKVRFIFRLAVSPQWRRHGVGSLLLNAAEAIAKSQGVIELALFADDQKEEVKQYYTRRGFVSSKHAYKCFWKPLK